MYLFLVLSIMMVTISMILIDIKDDDDIKVPWKPLTDLKNYEILSLKNKIKILFSTNP